MLHLKVDPEQFSGEFGLAVGERFVQMASDQELEGKDHVYDDGGKLEGNATYNIYGSAYALHAIGIGGIRDGSCSPSMMFPPFFTPAISSGMDSEAFAPPTACAIRAIAS